MSTELQKYTVTRLTKELGDKKLAEKIEQSIFSSARGTLEKEKKVWDYYPFRKRYKQLLASTLENLSFEHSNLRLGLLDSKSDEEVHNLVICDRRDLAPQLWNYTSETTEKGADDSRGMLKCSKCARKGLDAFQTEYSELQTRSSDEPMTIFAFCRQCNSRWKG